MISKIFNINFVNYNEFAGESAPVTKTPLPNPLVANSEDKHFSLKDHSHHILFCGTQIIQTRYYGDKFVHAVVFRTGLLLYQLRCAFVIIFARPSLC